MNVLMVGGFPAKIAVGLVVVGLAITGFVGGYFASVTAGLRKVIAGLIRAL